MWRRAPAKSSCIKRSALHPARPFIKQDFASWRGRTLPASPFGIALVVAAAVAWSTAPFFTRLLPFDSWTILFWRGLFGGGLIAALMVLMQGRAGLRELLGIGASGWLVASLSTVGMVCFIPALQLTSVSNVAVIIATGPFAAAAIAWLWLREMPGWRTMLASLVALIGVAIIAGDARANSDIFGLALACLMTVAIAAMTVAIRRHKNTSMVAAAAVSNLLGSLDQYLRSPTGITSVSREPISIGARDVRLLPGCVGPDAILCSARGYCLPDKSTLIATLETPLMPFWVWLAFQ